MTISPEILRVRPIIVACAMMATIMQALDTTIANVALPYMQGSLGATQDQSDALLGACQISAKNLAAHRLNKKGGLRRPSSPLPTTSASCFSSWMLLLCASWPSASPFRVKESPFPHLRRMRNARAVIEI